MTICLASGYCEGTCIKNLFKVSLHGPREQVEQVEQVFIDFIVDRHQRKRIQDTFHIFRYLQISSDIIIIFREDLRHLCHLCDKIRLSARPSATGAEEESASSTEDQTWWDSQVPGATGCPWVPQSGDSFEVTSRDTEAHQAMAGLRESSQRSLSARKTMEKIMNSNL